MSEQGETGAPGPLVHALRWVGSEEAYLDAPTVVACGPVWVGRYGGRTRAGAIKNEDGALVWADAAGLWEFAVLLDAHFSAESAALVLEFVLRERERILGILAEPIQRAFPLLHAFFVALFSSEDFRLRCMEVEGEASCLIAARKGNALWWLSVGDCVGYVFHPELAGLARLGEYRLNERRFFEWIGQRNTFDEAVPGYTTGIYRLMRGGATIIALTTDGLFESVTEFYLNPATLYNTLASSADLNEPFLERGALEALLRVHDIHGRDSATILAWAHHAS